WTRLDSRDALTDVVLDIAEGFQGERRPDAGFLLDLLLHIGILEGQHSAVGVVDQDDFLSPQQALGDDERTDRILADDAARIANNMGVAFLEAEDLVDIEASVHAGQDGHLLARWHGQVALGKRISVALVVGEQSFGNAHLNSPRISTSLRAEAARP